MLELLHLGIAGRDNPEKIEPKSKRNDLSAHHDVIASMASEGCTFGDIAKKIKVRAGSVSSYIRRHDIEIGKAGAKLKPVWTPAHTDELSMRIRNHETIKAINEALPFRPATIRKYANSLGYVVRAGYFVKEG